MYVGYIDDKPCFVAETREELETMLDSAITSIEEKGFAELYMGKIYLSEEALTNGKKDYVRSIRNFYLEYYIDGAVSNPLRWADMSQELKDMYTNYRRYLLDYTETKDWWLQTPKTLQEWQEGNN